MPFALVRTNLVLHVKHKRDHRQTIEPPEPTRP